MEEEREERQGCYTKEALARAVTQAAEGEPEEARRVGAGLSRTGFRP